MVALDDLFKKDFETMTDRSLLDFRKEQIQNLFNGRKGSDANVEREALIQIVDKELEMRFKKKAETRSNVALLISAISLLMSIVTYILHVTLNSVK